MLYPTLPEIGRTRQMIDVFGGYNHNLRIGDGEFYDMENMTSDYYPILSPRRQRGTFVKSQSLSGMIAKDEFCYVDGENFIIGDRHPVNLGLSEGEKKLVSMGSYVIILPDKKYINTADVSDFGDIEASKTTSAGVSFTLCKLDGTVYAENVSEIAKDTAPDNPSNMDVWLDTSVSPNVLKQYSTNASTWISITTTYVKISSDGLGVNFNEGDGVMISGIQNEKLSDLNGTTVIQSRGNDFIVVIGILNENLTQQSSVTVKRQMPTLDYITESDNRLWGCRYGESVNGETVNEIYACKLGDFKNWNCFQGISTDSYVASLGTDGPFTGAITHLGYPLFFKENCMHKVYGNFPANYQVQTIDCRGVQKGSHKSLAIVNEILYYKSRLGVCVYDGSLPSEISNALGEVSYFNAVGGAHGNKYYISMADIGGNYHLFVYDTSKGLWHREDNTEVSSFCSHQNEMYYIDKSEGAIKTLFGSPSATSENIEWKVESGIIGFDSPDKKYISNMTVRLSLDIGAKVYFYVMHDSSGIWEHVGKAIGYNLRSFVVPIRPRRCDHFRIKIEGVGGAKIYSICKTLEQGSEI